MGHESPTSLWFLSPGHPLKDSPLTTWSHFPYFDVGTCFWGVFCFFAKPKFKQNQNLIIYNIQISLYGCLGGSDSKIHLAMQAKTLVGSPGWEDSPGEGNGNPLKYSCLENPMDRRVWRAIVHGVTKSRTWLSNFLSLMIGTFFFKRRKWLAFKIMTLSENNVTFQSHNQQKLRRKND